MKLSSALKRFRLLLKQKEVADFVLSEATEEVNLTQLNSGSTVMIVV